jgi:tRNA pseudouridine38-40 synthase
VPDHGASEHLNKPVAMRRACFVVAYDGSGFHGFAPNPNVATVVGVLTDAMSRITRHAVDLVGAGRTDAGVHAWGQVVSCDIPSATQLDNLIRRVNRMCGPRLVVRSGEWVSDEFNARFSAQWRHYRYTVLNGPIGNPLTTSNVWHVARPLMLPAMQLACDPLIGEHDFTTFCRKPHVVEGSAEPSMRRRVMQARWTDVTDSSDLFEHSAPLGAGGSASADGVFPAPARLLRFDIRANAFCHQMVRSIVGTLVDVGRGRFHAGDIRSLMLARDRQVAAEVAPARGLVLWEVGYDGSARA